MEEKEIHDKYVKFRKDMYEGVVTGVRTSKRYGGVDFPLTVGPSPFADEIVLIDETSKGVNRKLEQLRSTLESKAFRIR
ncbi:hypothetical protein H5410_033471 [Solanum commersonii]|uniref:Uncharacterized protein n=1 Tax=Solanum commersonii TaxID=4109 RepID=A0A9J5YQ96_SOLCO|nr:hypothetical protein H5410_033471 [Solanum commersonii]